MRKRSPTDSVSVLALLVGALLAAPGPAEAQAVKVRLGSSLSPPALDAITPYVALERGFLKRYGIEAQVVDFRGDATHLKALLAGEVDLAVELGATAAMVTASKGAKIRLFMIPQPVTPFHFFARREAAGTLQAMAGKNMAVSGIGAISYHIPRIVLERSGVDPEKVKYVALGSPADRFKALLAGKIDATIVMNIEAAKLDKHPDVLSLAQVAKVLPEIPYTFAVAREEYIEKNLDTMHKVTRALIEANRWIAANKAGTIEIAAKVLKEETPEVIGKAYDLADPRLWGVNGDLPEAAYTYTADFLQKVGYMKDPVPYDKFFDRRFVDRALKELGRM